jgi:hypothetical protein
VLVGWRLLQLLHGEEVETVLQGVELASVVGDADLYDAFFRDALWMPDWPSRGRYKGAPWGRLELRSGLRGGLKQRPQEQVGLLALLSSAPSDSQEASRLRAEPAHVRIPPEMQSTGLSWLTLPQLHSLCLRGWEEVCELPPVKRLFADSLWPLPDTLEHLRLLHAHDIRRLRTDCPRLKVLELGAVDFDALPPLPDTLERISVTGPKLVDASALCHLPNLQSVQLEDRVRGWPAGGIEGPMPTATGDETLALLQNLLDEGELTLCGSLEALAEDFQFPLGAIVDAYGRAPGPHVASWLMAHEAVEDLFITDEVLSWRVRRLLVLGV